MKSEDREDIGWGVKMYKKQDSVHNLNVFYSFAFLRIKTWPSHLPVGFPNGSAIKNPPAMQESQETQAQSVGWWRSPGWGNGNPLQYSCLEKLHGQRSLEGYSPWGHRVGHDWATEHTACQRLKGDILSLLTSSQELVEVESESRGRSWEEMALDKEAEASLAKELGL